MVSLLPTLNTKKKKLNTRNIIFFHLNHINFKINLFLKKIVQTIYISLILKKKSEDTRIVSFNA